ncbi:MAG: ATP-binding cassette domain-containing protein [Phycisphaera sp.]|nr:ATP-binding cassette domain-containing protein [Phycisphaera sp.]
MTASTTLDSLTTRTPATDKGVPDGVVIKCSALSKLFKDFWLRNRVRAVDQIDLEIRRGEVFGLLGPNGSGKSTTIKMILGLLHPSSGRIAVLGKPPGDVKTKTQIGYLPEESYLYPFLNARETLDYYGRLFKLNAEQRKRRIDMLLDMVGLTAVQRRPIREYSKGMQRRIGLAQALINDPHLLILDEPTSGLDPIGTRQIKDLILKLAQRGKTVLLCSHLLGDVEEVCDRVAIMFGGKVRADGTVDELLQKQGQTNLLTQDLDQQTLDEVEAILTKHGRHIEKVERPRQRLENLFLDIVHQAQTQGAATSGARSGGAVAGFLLGEEELRGSHLPESAQTQRVLDELVKPPSPSIANTTAAGPATPTPSAMPAPSGKPISTNSTTISPHEDVLKGLVNPTTAQPTGSQTGNAPPAAPPPREQLDVLNGLVQPNSPQPPAPVAPSPASPPTDPHSEAESTISENWGWAQRRGKPAWAGDNPNAKDTPPQGTPEHHEEHIDSMSLEELPVADDVAEGWAQTEEDPDHEAAPPKTTDDQNDETDEERPFDGFLDALKKVKPYEEDEKKNK